MLYGFRQLHVKIDEIYKYIAKELKFELKAKFELDRPLPKPKNKKSNWINDEICG